MKLNRIISLVFILWLAVTLVGCGVMYRDDNKALRAVEAYGFTNPVIKDSGVVWHEYSGCAGSDDWKYSVEATNPAGKRVELTVCTGLWKDSTVRVK